MRGELEGTGAMPENVTPERELGALGRGVIVLRLASWAPVVLGLLILFVPTLTGLLGGLWATDEQAHGPIVLSIACWLMYRKWPDMMEAARYSRPSRAGWVPFAFGLLLYVVGRSQGILLFEVGSAIWLIVGLGLVLFGTGAVRRQWFPLFFMLFMLPLPGQLVDALTMPMKMAVSYIAENILFSIGYPIARTGVVLQIGQYKLLVADACAGLHTLFTLEALGLLYLNLVRHESLVRNVTLAVFVVPISFTANVIRVMVLTLITYHFGDAAGQGFLHGFAGMVLFLSALLLIIGADSLLQYFIRRREPIAATTGELR
jgi:exosortase B